jgi:MFS family permease
VVLIGLGLFIHHRLEETPAFRGLRAADPGAGADDASAGGAHRHAHRRSPVLEAVSLYPREIALAAGAFMAVQVTFYILVTWIIAYGTDPTRLALPRGTMLAGVMIGALAMAPSLLVSGVISDRFGRRGIYMAGAALLGVWAFAIFPLIDTKSLLWIGVATGVGQAFVAMMYGPQAAFLAELFSTHVRYSAASLGYQLGAIFGGALAPIIATALLTTAAGTVAIAAYIAVACAITVLSVWRLAETHQTDLHGGAVDRGLRDPVESPLPKRGV